MKKLFYVFFISLFILPVSVFAVSSSSVNYKVDDYIVDANIDNSGNLLIKEIIGVKGTFNGYIRDLVYKNSNLNEFTGLDSDFGGSAIYNASNIEINKIGKINYNKELDFDAFNEEIIPFSECNYSVNCYQENYLTDGTSLKMYNETINDITYFYIEYLLKNVVVVHNDVAEVYYNFIGYDFDDMINNYKLRLTLPTTTTEQIRVWAHGPLTGEVNFLATEENETTTYYGGWMHVEKLNANTPVDMRMTFPKELITVDHPELKKSGVDALDKILKVEQERADEANREREKATRVTNLIYTVTGLYFTGLVFSTIYVYKKYDKEYTPDFEGEYYRDFIDDYDVTSVEYLFDKRITDKSFSTSILNMIYKKNIKYEQNDKKDYTLIKVNEDNLNESEKIIMDMLFNKAGDGNKVTLKEIKKYANRISGTNSEFLNNYNTWKTVTTRSAKNENFYESKSKVAFIGLLFFILMCVISQLQIKIGLYNFIVIATVLCGIAFIIYLCAFRKKTKRGIEDFSKWKAFKKFLKDFGRFNEKELPEITLWERYLVYASIFGLASEVSKTMKIKFDELNRMDNNRDIFFDYMLYSNLNHSINSTVHTSVITANNKVSEAKAAEISRSASSSGGGFGGGFSSGGGFGGGGGGGRGF